MNPDCCAHKAANPTGVKYKITAQTDAISHRIIKPIISPVVAGCAFVFDVVAII